MNRRNDGTEEGTGKTALHCAFEAAAEQNALSLLELGASMTAVTKVCLVAVEE
jgi:hypothetical protein